MALQVEVTGIDVDVPFRHRFNRFNYLADITC